MNVKQMSVLLEILIIFSLTTAIVSAGSTLKPVSADNFYNDGDGDVYDMEEDRFTTTTRTSIVDFDYDDDIFNSVQEIQEEVDAADPNELISKTFAEVHKGVHEMTTDQQLIPLLRALSSALKTLGQTGRKLNSHLNCSIGHGKEDPEKTTIFFKTSNLDEEVIIMSSTQLHHWFEGKRILKSMEDQTNSINNIIKQIISFTGHGSFPSRKDIDKILLSDITSLLQEFEDYLRFTNKMLHKGIKCHESTLLPVIIPEAPSVADNERNQWDYLISFIVLFFFAIGFYFLLWEAFCFVLKSVRSCCKAHSTKSTKKNKANYEQI